MNKIQQTIIESKKEFEEMVGVKDLTLNNININAFLDSYTTKLLTAVKESLPEELIMVDLIELAKLDRRSSDKWTYTRSGFNLALKQVKDLLQESLKEIK